MKKIDKVLFMKRYVKFTIQIFVDISGFIVCDYLFNDEFRLIKNVLFGFGLVILNNFISK